MKKYSYEFRANAVKIALDGKHSMNSAAKELNVAFAQLREWVQHFEKQGLNGLCLHNGTYTGDFKLMVVKSTQEQHLSSYEAAIMFDIPHARTVSKWIKLFSEEGASALYLDNRGKPKKRTQKKTKAEAKNKEDLLSQIEELKMENEFLKKR